MRDLGRCGGFTFFFIGGVIREEVFGVDEVFWGQLRCFLGGEG